MDYLDWARQDLAAAIEWMSGQDLPLYLVGHSYGGHALGLLPHPEHVRGAYVFGTGAGWHGWMALLERVRVLAIWRVLGSLLTRWKGYLPSKLLGLGEDLPLDVYRQWRRWCHYPRYFFDDPTLPGIGAQFARIDVSIVAVNALDDAWAPPRSRDAFMSGYRCAPWEPMDLNPLRLSMKHIGHMGIFPAAGRVAVVGDDRAFRRDGARRRGDAGALATRDSTRGRVDQHLRVKRQQSTQHSVVQPNPSRRGYSPPAPAASVTAYFSTSLPVSRNTATSWRIQRSAISSASEPWPWRCRPRTAIHCSGAQPVGASHCWRVRRVVVASLCGCSRSARAPRHPCRLAAVGDVEIQRIQRARCNVAGAAALAPQVAGEAGQARAAGLRAHHARVDRTTASLKREALQASLASEDG